MRTGRRALLLMVSLGALLLGSCSGSGHRCADGEVENFTVNARTTHEVEMGPIEAGETIEGFVVFAGREDPLRFFVLTPRGRRLEDTERVSGRHDFRFAAPERGNYTFIFDNRFHVSSDKSITLVYRCLPPASKGARENR